MQKYTLLVATASTIFAGRVIAADLSTKRAAPIFASPAPVLSWTGFYGGINAGGASGDGSVRTTGAPVSFNPAGVAMGAPATANALAAVLNSNAHRQGGQFIGGGQLGYNYQFSSVYLAGLEADIQGLAGSGRTSSAVTTSSFAPFGFPANNYGATSSFTQRLTYLGTARGRLGFLVTPSILIYATGGLAYGGAKAGSSIAIQQTFPGAFATITPPIFGGASGSRTAVGSTVGGGLEWMFASKWTAKFEYLYYDLGTVTVSAPFTQIINNPPFVNTPWATAQAKTRAHFNGSIAHIGVSYHFD